MEPTGMPNSTLRVLVMCDEEFTALEVRQALGAELLMVPAFGAAHEHLLRFQCEEIVLGGRWEIHLDGARYDLAIIATDDASHMRLLSDHPLLRDAIGAILYLPGPGEIGAWQLRPGVDAILRRPCTQLAVRQMVEQLFRQLMGARGDGLDDASCLAALQTLLQHQLRRVTPVLDPRRPGGISYPSAESVVGMGPQLGRMLEHMVDLGVFRKHTALRVRRCAACASALLSFSECCARCGSIDYTVEPVIHHFRCAHVDILSRFQQGAEAEMVCPKCSEPLMQIGRDYERPNGCVHCRACNHLAPAARVQVTCMECGVRCAPEETTEAIAFAFEATPHADAVALAGRFDLPQDAADVLERRAHGLFSRVYVLHALQRECERFRRHGHPASLLLIEVAASATGAGGAAVVPPERMAPHCAAVVEGLRALDAACIYQGSIVAVLLPDTPAEGAVVVANRIARRVETMLTDTGGEVHIGVATLCEELATPEAVLRHALAALRPGEETAAEVVVVLDELAEIGPGDDARS